MFDPSLGELLVIGLLALFLVGPEKLPLHAATLGQWVRIARGMVDDATERMREELGPEFDDVDRAELDPRKYHPKRLLMDAWNAAPEHGPSTSAGPQRELDPVGVSADEPDHLALAEARAEAGHAAGSLR